MQTAFIEEDRRTKIGVENGRFINQLHMMHITCICVTFPSSHRVTIPSKLSIQSFCFIHLYSLVSQYVYTVLTGLLENYSESKKGYAFIRVNIYGRGQAIYSWVIITIPYCGRKNTGWSKRDLKCTHLDSESWQCYLVKTKQDTESLNQSQYLISIVAAHGSHLKSISLKSRLAKGIFSFTVCVLIVDPA